MKIKGLYPRKGFPVLGGCLAASAGRSPSTSRVLNPPEMFDFNIINLFRVMIILKKTVRLNFIP